MADETIRTHIVLPSELVEAIDRLVGQRKRSAFVTQAVAEKLERELLRRALAGTAGALANHTHPEWDTPDKISAWVREMRSIDRDATDRKLSRFRSS